MVDHWMSRFLCKTHNHLNWREREELLLYWKAFKGNDKTLANGCAITWMMWVVVPLPVLTTFGKRVICADHSFIANNWYEIPIEKQKQCNGWTAQARHQTRNRLFRFRRGFSHEISEKIESESELTTYYRVFSLKERKEIVWDIKLVLKVVLKIF